MPAMLAEWEESYSCENLVLLKLDQAQNQFLKEYYFWLEVLDVFFSLPCFHSLW